MRKGVHRSVASAFNHAEPGHSAAANEESNLPGRRSTRRTILAGMAMLAGLPHPALARTDPDVEIVDLARRLLAGIEAEYPLRLTLEEAWAASERVRRQLLSADPQLQQQRKQVNDRLRNTAEGRRHVIAYDRWNAARGECRDIAERILAKAARTGPGLAAQVLANDVLRREDAGQSDSGPLLRTAAAMLGARLPAHFDHDNRWAVHRAGKLDQA